MHVNDCWACRDSRAFCDCVHPRCSRCTRYGKACQYGLRLSWPKANNRKRSLTHTIENGFGIMQNVSQVSFVNATSWDIQLHDYLWTSQGLRGNQGVVFELPDPPAVLSWLPTQLGYEERQLLDHFEYTAFSTLATFDPDKKEFLSLLLRLALSDNAPSSMAVLQSALALSSLHRHGLQPDAFRLKARALRILITSGKHCIETSRIIQHVAAGMILCHFAMLDIGDASTQWFWYLSGAKHLIDHTDLSSQMVDGECSRVVNWVNYHTVMSQFSLQHWHTAIEPIVYKSPIKDIRNCADIDQAACQRHKIKGITDCSHEILRLLYLVFEMILKPTDLGYHSKEYENSLRCLERKINTIDPSVWEDLSDTTSDLNNSWVAALELYKLAALIYLKRASRNFSGTSTQIDKMVERAFVILGDLETFDLGFPLLIIGCEARADDQRMITLELIERTLKASSLRSLHGLQIILQRIWVQDDLAVDHELDYLKRLDAVINSCHTMPTFA